MRKKMTDSNNESYHSLAGSFFSRMNLSLRSKLVIIFLTAKIIPIILIVAIAWQQMRTLGDQLRGIAVEDSTIALNLTAVENIERMTTDTAMLIADFLYGRDADIRYISSLAGMYGDDIEGMTRAFELYVSSKTSRVMETGEWILTQDGKNWVNINKRDTSGTIGESSNSQNDEFLNGTGFSPRAADGYTYVDAPLYDEITFIGLDGNELVKISTTEMDNSLKNNYKDWFVTGDLKNVSIKSNTFVRAETYWESLKYLTQDKDNDIYVSDVIGAYVGSNYIGMYTPDNVTAAAETRGYDIAYEPEEQAFAGKENPNGTRFEGIVRWASPVYVDGVKIGYVTLALNHDHIMEFVDHQTPMSDRYTDMPSAFEGNYAFIWDYQCRSIAHPRHHSIVGYNPFTGNQQIPWISEAIYRKLLEKCGIDEVKYGEMTAAERVGVLQENWGTLINDTIDGKPVYELIIDQPLFENQARTPSGVVDPNHTAAADLTWLGLIGLDGRYLNNAPQCTGWLDLAGRGGSGSLYILWSGIYKLNTAAAIPYYTGQYSGRYAPDSMGNWNRVGFGFVAIGAGLDDFTAPAENTKVKLEETISKELTNTSYSLLYTTVLLVGLVILIAVWTASFITNSIRRIVYGISKFRRGERHYRFNTTAKDEFGMLEESFDEMADGIVSSVKSPLVITDMDLKIIYINEFGLSLNKIEISEAVGKPYALISIYPPETEYCPIRALREGREAEVIYKKDNERYYRGNANYLTDRTGEKIGYIIISTDLTELSLKQQQLEQAVESANIANKHKGEFLARMSHEIRTPMNAIIGITDIVRHKIAEMHHISGIYEVERHMIQINSSSQHLLGLINDILDLSKIEAGKLEIMEESVDLRQIAEMVNSVINQRCIDKQLKYEPLIEKFDPWTFYCDSLRLRQVLINLLGNAVKFTPEFGTISFEIKRMDRRENKSLIQFVIRDTGIGISEETLSEIFKPFEQGGASVTRQYGGTGLGLSISQHIVQLFGSEINVSSKIGEGSEFRFSIWLRESTEIHQQEIENAENTIGDDFAGKRLLLVDDVDINRMIVSTMFEETGIEIDEADDGFPAVETFENSPIGTYDLIFMDVQMPRMDGYEAARRIRALNRPDAKVIPIIALTANAFQEDIKNALNAGMNAHLAKPIEYKSILNILYRFLKN